MQGVQAESWEEMLLEYQKTKENLMAFKNAAKTKEDVSYYSDMIRDVELAINKLCAYLSVGYQKRYPTTSLWDPTWIQQQVAADYSLEDEVISRLCQEEQEECELQMDLSLSPKKMEVLQMISDGLTYRETAKILHVKYGTVSKHLKLAREQMNKQKTTVQMQFVLD